jgi:hypothetical protein
MQAKAKSMQDGHHWLRLDWIGRWLWLENRFTPSASFLSLIRVSFVMSLSLEKQREAMLKWCKLKGVPCADM